MLLSVVLLTGHETNKQQQSSNQWSKIHSKNTLFL